MDQTEAIAALQRTMGDWYVANARRDLPWRMPKADGSFDPYKILVSELMLQQTQVPRVVPKFNDFIRHFPTFEHLAAAPLSDVLRAWNGLGYNRRAKFLWQTAGLVTAQHGGRLPDERAQLVRLPGVGPNTAGAVLAYAFNQPAVFVETNIRTVVIQQFFAGEQQVSDAAILKIVAQLVAAQPDPRTFYWMMMDYGTYLKQVSGNAARAARAYTRQSPFAGSRRQVRGRVLRLLAAGPSPLAALSQHIADDRLAAVLDDLQAEGLVERRAGSYQLPS